MTLKRISQFVWCVTLGWTLAPSPVSSARAQEASLPPSPPAVTTFFPLAEVHRGQRGVAYTVFEGTTPEPMAVEILGVLKDSQGPGRDLILARLHGSKPEYTGVVAGMSGSPVYIDSKLAGALSYRIGQFSKEPIAGITPIAEMLEVANTPAPARPSTTPSDLKPGPLQQIDTPLIFSGFSPETLDRFGDRFRALGLSPVAGLGGSDARATQPEPLIPGSAVSAILVRGDLAMAGTCTVTFVDANQLLACGHPITQAGPVSMPMTKATVVATLPSPLNAFKIVNTTETVGSFTEDRASAIAGRFHLPARMIPVEVAVGSHTFHFEVLDDRQLTPSTMLVSVYQALQGTNAAAAEQSYRLAGTLTLAHQAPVQLAGIMAPTSFNTGAVNAALYVGDRFNRVYENPDERPSITALNLRLDLLPTRQTAVLEAARLSRSEARPGETLDLELSLRPFQSEPQTLHIPVRLPASLASGPLRLLISDAATADRLTSPSPAAASKPLQLAEIVASLNRLHPNNQVVVTLLEHTPQAVLASGTLAQLPLSMANVLEPLRDNQQMQLTGESALSLVQRETPFALTGSQVLRLTIR